MASNMQSFQRMLKMLRENSSSREKREALTYIRSNSKKLQSAGIVKEEQCKELCKLVIEAFANGNNDVQNEAYGTLNVIIQDFKEHTLNLFEVMSQINEKNRLKILKLLEIIEDNAISMIANDPHAVQFFTDCMSTIQTNKMPWIASTACVDNLKALIDAENKPLSDDQRLEEETVNYCIILLRRLYKLAAITSDTNVEKFDALLLDKVMLLAYMGHKRQRGAALKLLQQSLATNILSHIRTKLANAWVQYKSALQTTYCKRMLLLVSACELDWAIQWNISIQFLGVDLHKGAGLINDLLSIEEKAFKSTDTITRRQAFLSWKLLVDNFALDPQELATARRIKLLCIPLSAKNSKTELIAITKLEVWWHVIIKLYKDIVKFVNPVLTQFLNFCFGPLGDTPLLSSKCDIIVSPGKRFYKTKVIAVDALCQLLVTKQLNHNVFSPILEERLPHSMTDAVFQECYKSIIHSVGEALLVLSQLTDAEMKNRYQLGKILWTNLINYVQESKMENKENMYKDIITVIAELANYAESKAMIRQLILDIILFEITDLSKEFNLKEDILSVLLFKLLQISILSRAEKEHYNAIKSLLRHCIKSSKENVYYPHAFKCLKEMYHKLHTLQNGQCKNESVIRELWVVLVDVLISYMDDLQEINEGTTTQHNLTTVESIVMFPFMYMCIEDQNQIQEVTKTWKRLCKHLEMRVDLIESIKTNEILMNIATTMQRCLVKNEKSYHLIISSLDNLLSSIDYKLLLAHTEVPAVMNLLVSLVIYFLSNQLIKESDAALKALSAVLITIYGHSLKKIVPYLLACQPAIELMLATEIEALYGEIASTWESIISILKGLGKLCDQNLISCYKKIITLALNHPNVDVREQTMSLFELKDILNSSTKLILEEIEKTENEIKLITSDVPTKTNDIIEETQNEKADDTCLEEPGSPKDAPKEIEDYVFIKTDFKFDVDRLTEHQKESLKRKREDIPALYNDLSQSCSQDTQNLQEWFNRKNKAAESMETEPDKNDNVLTEKIADNEANKENEVEVKSQTVKEAVETDTKSAETDGQIASSESAQVNGDVNSGENSLEDETKGTKEANEDLEANTTKDCEINTFNFNTQEESPAGKDSGTLSPSMLKSGKRHERPSKPCVSQKLDEIVSSQSEQPSPNQTLQTRLRMKTVQCKSDADNKQNALDDMENKSLKSEKRGVKRKSASDSESEKSSLRQRRKTSIPEISSDTDSCKSTESDTTNTALRGEEINEKRNVSQRTKNEISRLRINMVFDSPLPNSRRSKGDKEDDKKPRKIENRGGRGRGRRKVKRLDRNSELKKIEDTKSTFRRKRNSLDKVHKIKIDKGENTPEKPATSTSDPNVTLPDTEEPDKTEAVPTENPSDEKQATVETSEQLVEIKEEVILNDQNDKPAAEQFETQDDMEDIIESSQQVSELEKKSNEKPSAVKVNSVEEAVCAEDKKVENVSNNCDNASTEVSKSNVKEPEETSSVKVNELNVSTPVPEKSSGNEKQDATETQKSSEGSSFKTVIEFTSPKTNAKGQLKFKTYSGQGRAAHMLGLVTKQARIEAGCQIITIDDESVLKKIKLKDTDNETPSKKFTLKDVDKVTCSSRQEKIFNNMKSSDYCPSPPIKLFSNLKNDGEKIFPKADKSTEYISIHTDAQAEKGEETTVEMDELPILEWSSANPPSLTASPSVSILKRRQSMPEPDPESTTPSKRKRVSFADPPVSKEMGYEITSNDSVQKTNKFVSRGMFGRKDTPLRLKPIKKLISIDADRMDKDEESDMINMSEIDLQCEKENELLTKMAEELEYSENDTINTDVQIPFTARENELTNTVSVEVNGSNKIKIDNLNTEFEISQDSTFSKNAISTSVNKVEKNKVNQVLDASGSSNVSLEKTELNESVTQDDIFNGTDVKHNITENSVDSSLNDTQNISIQNSSLGSLKLNASKESITNRSLDGYTNAENLEDTLDAENLTRLNSSVNSDEIFCGNLIRTSTQTADNIQEQDTLPVTDSVFGSLPLSQDSQSTSEYHVKTPNPESLNSVHPIYPTLILCHESISSIVQHLTNPLWVSYKSVLGGKSSSVSVSAQNSSHVVAKPMITLPISSVVSAVALEPLGNLSFAATSGASVGSSAKPTETCTANNSVCSHKPEVQKTTRSVAAQMALEDLLDEIDVNLVLESAVRRCTPERILLQYKNKMKHIPQIELEKETIRMLGAENVKNCTEVTLKAACRACGVNKVLLRLPDIFSSDKQFFIKVLNAYKKKIQVSDCLDILDFAEVKDAICKKCTSSELAEMLSKKLKDEEQEGIREPMTELSSLNAMLKRMPMDLIISHTVANEELIPSRVVLDIALQNNSTNDIAQALECQSSLVTKDVFEKLWSSQFAIKHIEQLNSKQDLLKLFKAISLKLSQQDLLQAFYESMSAKVMINQEKI
ncbi:uncharacterized protein LOC100880674 isoform X2 [Megachile rotundata]|uniref:uncharacterized protein LOC100880674 isoform X2 n=1 Tax=Megachile rotundata TaxID=143995 RepID=UPI000614F17F|nr:PREDICTED: telomere-associated protein RIF1 isoform X2 [Megachile rotundata]